MYPRPQGALIVHLCPNGTLFMLLTVHLWHEYTFQKLKSDSETFHYHFFYIHWNELFS